MASVYEDTENLLGADDPRGDADAEKMASWDFGGDLLFGYGDASRNRAIDQRVRELEKFKGQISAGQRKRLEDAIAANEADWQKLTTQVLGADGQKLHNLHQGFQEEEARNIDALKGIFGQYQDQEDLFNDPSFYGDVGDITNAAFPTEATKSAQREALAQMKAQSSAQETAAERFQRLMAERTVDANMRGQREAIAHDLKARGVYGSGAEVAMNMMSQADEANRRYLADQAANAQAQQRASQMLGQSADLASQMRGQETQEGSFANQVSMFNNQTDQATANARSAAKQQGRGVDNAERNKMGTTVYEAGNRALGNKRGDNRYETSTATGMTQGGMQVRNTGERLLNESDEEYKQRIGAKQSGLVSSKETPLLGKGMG